MSLLSGKFLESAFSPNLRPFAAPAVMLSLRNCRWNIVAAVESLMIGDSHIDHGSDCTFTKQLEQSISKGLSGYFAYRGRIVGFPDKILAVSPPP
jgi:hypothetical protein